MRSIVWYRGHDLRVMDHTPLRKAAEGRDVIPVFVLEPASFDPQQAHRVPHHTQYLIDALVALQADLVRLGSRLLVVPGPSTEAIPRLAHVLNADRVLAQASTAPVGRGLERKIASKLGRRLHLCEGETLLAPGVLRGGSGSPYSIFGHFVHAFRASVHVGLPAGAPKLRPLPPELDVATTEVPRLESLAARHNDAILAGGATEAAKRQRRFLRSAAALYVEQRNRLDRAGTSRLSADIKFGAISVRQIWSAVRATALPRRQAEAFQSELLWREFAYDTLWNRPDVLDMPFQSGFDGFPWREDEDGWRRWVTGATGYPVVDAAARELTAEGFVPNRARMIAASFLTKHLLIDYRRGESYYMQWLTDGDLASNSAGWQWVVGCGNGAQPYFRVINPVLQGEKFDPDGDYVRRWVPELRRVPSPFIHRPWTASTELLRAAGVRLGETYPMPVVGQEFARSRFLAVAQAHLKPARRARQEDKR